VIVAANSVVAGKIPDNAIVQGNPAKVVFIRR
jgi:acetyltransferase-like isoleucine patch superfamily enzyme